MAQIARVLLAFVFVCVLSNCSSGASPCEVGRTECGAYCCEDTREVCVDGVACRAKCEAGKTECGAYCCDGETEVCVDGVACQQKGPMLCIPETPAAFCERMVGMGRVCGTITEDDNCNVLRTVNCGVAACTNETYCNAGTNTCLSRTCTPETELAFRGRMLAAGRECGAVNGIDANCGTQITIDLGTTACASGQCDVDNVCVPV
ncbi:MAG: hypothetical protein FWC28_05805, partial [Proteobacteria bacterium]|nr:hypothetical protein [Pseudomonadota bacterium]